MMRNRIYLFIIFSTLSIAAVGQNDCPTLILDLKNESAFANAVAEEADLIKAHKKLGDHPNRTNPDILRSRKSFDEYDNLGYIKNNPHTGSEMFNPESGGYVVVHPGHNIAGNPNSSGEFSMAEAYSKRGERVILRDEKIPDPNFGGKTPDAEVNGIVYDFKNFNSPTNVVSNMENYIVAKTARSNASRISFNLQNEVATVEDVNLALNAVRTRIVNDNGFIPPGLAERVDIVLPGGEIRFLTKEQILDGATF